MRSRRRRFPEGVPLHQRQDAPHLLQVRDPPSALRGLLRLGPALPQNRENLGLAGVEQQFGLLFDFEGLVLKRPRNGLVLGKQGVRPARVDPGLERRRLAQVQGLVEREPELPIFVHVKKPGLVSGVQVPLFLTLCVFGSFHLFGQLRQIGDQCPELGVFEGLEQLARRGPVDWVLREHLPNQIREFEGNEAGDVFLEILTLLDSLEGLADLVFVVLCSTLLALPMTNLTRDMPNA